MAKSNSKGGAGRIEGRQARPYPCRIASSLLTKLSMRGNWPRSWLSPRSSSTNLPNQIDSHPFGLALVCDLIRRRSPIGSEGAKEMVVDARLRISVRIERF